MIRNIYILLLLSLSFGAYLHEISIDMNTNYDGFYYYPEYLPFVGIGDTVRWTNYTDIPQTSTADDGDWDSGTLLYEQIFEHVFTSPGFFNYHSELTLPNLDCSFKGRIDVCVENSCDAICYYEEYYCDEDGNIYDFCGDLFCNPCAPGDVQPCTIGCTNPLAINYALDATADDGSCYYFSEGIIGGGFFPNPEFDCDYAYLFYPNEEYQELFTILNYEMLEAPVINDFDFTEEQYIQLTFEITEALCGGINSYTPCRQPAINIISYSYLLLGDINLDGYLNVLDVVILANIILSGNNIPEGDINVDGLCNMLDIVELVNIILTQP